MKIIFALFAVIFLSIQSSSYAHSIERTIAGRTYELHLPSHAKASGPLPIIVFFHGFSMDAAMMQRMTCPGGNESDPLCLNALADPKGKRSFSAGGGKNGMACAVGYVCE